MDIQVTRRRFHGETMTTSVRSIRSEKRKRDSNLHTTVRLATTELGLRKEI